MFEMGEVVEHKVNGEYLFILEISEHEEHNYEYVCRTKAFDVKAFYEFELRKKSNSIK